MGRSSSESSPTMGHGGAAVILKGGLAGLAIRLGSAALVVVVTIILARSLGPAGFGIYSYIYVLITLLTIPAQFGVTTIVVRETARAHDARDWGRMVGVWQWAMRQGMILCATVISLLGIVAFFIRDSLSAEQMWTLGWGAILLLLLALGNIRSAMLRGLRRVVQSQIPEYLVRHLVFILVLACLLVFSGPDSITPSRVMSGHVAAAALAFLLGAWMLVKARPVEIQGNAVQAVSEGRAWIQSAIPMGVVSGMPLLNKHVDLMILGLLAGPEEVGIYRVAAQIVLLVALPVTAVNLALSPHVARAYAGGRTAEIQQLSSIGTTLAFACALAATAAIYLLGEPGIRVLFGGEYLGAYQPMVVLAIGQVLFAACGSAAVVSNMMGQERGAASIFVLAIVGNVILNWILIPRYGIVGAAVSTSASLFLCGIALCLWLLLRKKVDTSVVSASLLAASWVRRAASPRPWRAE